MRIYLLLYALRASSSIARRFTTIILIGVVFTICPRERTRRINKRKLVTMLIIRLDGNNIVRGNRTSLYEDFGVLVLRRNVANATSRGTRAKEGLSNLL